MQSKMVWSKEEAGLQVVNMKVVEEDYSVHAKIIPELGNNLISLKLERNGIEQELIYIPTELKDLRAQRFYGNPILFPFPGRIPQGRFQFQGQKFQVPVNFQDGTAIHGFVYNKNWLISEISESLMDKPIVKSKFRSDPEIEKSFPFPFALQITYILQSSELEMIFNAKNLGEKDLPFGYGIHPYFLLTGNRRDWTLNLAANDVYELVNILPTGVTKTVPPQFDFRAGKSLEEVYMDDLFGDIQRSQDGRVSASLKNEALNLELSVISDQNFEYYVLYAPPGKPFICIEPYTCIPNAFNLVNSGVQTGLKVLAPHESFTAHIWFEWKYLVKGA